MGFFGEMSPADLRQKIFNLNGGARLAFREGNAHSGKRLTTMARALAEELERHEKENPSVVVSLSSMAAKRSAKR